MVLQFQEEILLAEEIHVIEREFLGVHVAVFKQCLVDVAEQAARERNQAFGIARQQLLINARLVIKTFQVTGGDQAQQIAITFLVFAQQHQVIVAASIAARSASLGRNVNFTPDHRMHAPRFRLIVEFDGANRSPWSVIATAGIF